MWDFVPSGERSEGLCEGRPCNPLTPAGWGVINTDPTRRHRLARPRTPGSQPGDPGSNPGGAAFPKEKPILFDNGGSSNGRTPGSGPGSRGSNPCPPATLNPFRLWSFWAFLLIQVARLSAQPVSFQFMLPETVRVDSPFSLRINALTPQGLIDPNFQESGTLWLIGPSRADTLYLEPYTVDFFAGIAQLSIRLHLAGQVKLLCITPSLSDTSPFFWSFPGPYAYIQILWPGEIPDPGTPTGKLGEPTPPAYLSTDTIPFRIRLTDAFSNVVGLSDSISLMALSSTGVLPFAQYPTRTFVSEPEETLWVQFRTTGDPVWISAQSLTVLQIQGVSATLTIRPGPPAYLLPLLPGETLLPGDTTTLVDSTPGKSGTPETQFLERPFLVSVYAVDAAYNPITDLDPVYGHLVDVVGFDPYGGTSAQSDGPYPFTEQGLMFQVVCPYQGYYRFFVVDSTAPQYSTPWATIVRVEAQAGQLHTWADPARIPNQGSSKIFAQVLSPAGNPLAGKTVFYQLLQGDGDLNPLEVETDLEGVAYSVYTASGFATGDTAWIQVRVDSLIDTVEVTVQGQRIRARFDVYPNPVIFSEDGELTIAYRLVLPDDQDLSKVKISIFTAYGDRVWEREIPVGQEGARLNEINFVTWNGKNGQGYPVASGMYDVFVSLYRGREIYRQFHRSIGVIR